MATNTYKLKFSGTQIDDKLTNIDNKVNNTDFNATVKNLNDLITVNDNNINLSLNNFKGEVQSKFLTKDTEIFNIQQDIETHNADIVKLDINIQANKQNLEELSTSLNELNNKSINITNTASGTKIELKDSLEARLKGLKIYGKSTSSKLYIGDKNGIVSLFVNTPDNARVSQHDFQLNQGLHGMQVSENESYIDKNNTKWLSDILDFSNFTLTRNIKRITLNGVSEETEDYQWGTIGSGDSGYFYIDIGPMYSVKDHMIFCYKSFNQVSITSKNTNIGIDVINSETFGKARILVRPNIAGIIPGETGSVAAFKEWLANSNNTLHVLVIPEEPEVISLIDESGKILDAYQNLVNTYNNITLYQPETILFASNNAHLEIKYAANDVESINEYVKEQVEHALGNYVNPVSSAWEQKMLDRLDLFIKPTKALRRMPKCYGSKWHEEGTTLPGINYSSVGNNEDTYYHGLVGVQVPLKTYYSAMANPASIMYTSGDVDTSANNISSYYGITCSSLASFICGFPVWVYTQEMGGITTVDSGDADYIDTTWPDLEIPISNEDDLFKVQRGDLLVNTLDKDATKSGSHVKVVKDVVYHRQNGKLMGFNVVEATHPCVAITFMNLNTFLAQFNEERPYHLLRFDKTNLQFDLSKNEISYSTAIMPNKGEAGLYLLGTEESPGETIQLYIPDTESQTIYYSFNGVVSETAYSINTLSTSEVNDVIVYNFIPTEGIGTYVLWTDNYPDDPTTFTVIENKPEARDVENEDNKTFIKNPPAYQSEYDKLIAELEKLKSEGA